MASFTSFLRRKLFKPAAKEKGTVLRGAFDRPMFVIIILLIFFGCIMVFSASYAYAFSKYGDSSYYISKQILFVGLGFLGMMLIASFPYTWFRDGTWALFILSTILLIVVLFAGTAEDDAKRWLNIGVTFQPSEISKFAIILMVAWVAQKHRAQIMKRDGTLKTYFTTFMWGTVYPMVYVALTCGLIALENHLSGVIIVFCIGAACVWIGGGKRVVYVLGLLLVAGAFYIVVFQTELLKPFLEDYQYTRIDMWLNPENYDAKGKLWQTLQGLYAVGSGGIFGRGLGNSLQKHLFVSQPQNDFIFSIVCEELGMIGAAALLALYLVFFVRALHIAKRAPDIFSAVTAIGIGSHVMIQALLNMMVVTAILPNTGISLPFISYGGSSLIILMAEMGVLLSISRYSRVQQ